MSDAPSFGEYIASLSPFTPKALGVEPAALAVCERATATITSLSPLDRAKLAGALAADPVIAPALGNEPAARSSRVATLKTRSRRK